MEESYLRGRRKVKRGRGAKGVRYQCLGYLKGKIR
jgi:hypothetical protein